MRRDKSQYVDGGKMCRHSRGFLLTSVKPERASVVSSIRAHGVEKEDRGRVWLKKRKRVDPRPRLLDFTSVSTIPESRHAIRQVKVAKGRRPLLLQLGILLAFCMSARLLVGDRDCFATLTVRAGGC